VSELPDLIYHLAIEREWADARRAGEYRMSTLGRTLDDEGFIHCSFEHQVRRVADLFYGERDDIVLLSIDPRGLQAELRVETPPGAAEAFPHVYGPLNLEAVVRAEPFRPGET
jgi:glutathione S-transferase